MDQERGVLDFLLVLDLTLQAKIMLVHGWGLTQELLTEQVLFQLGKLEQLLACLLFGATTTRERDLIRQLPTLGPTLII